MSDLLKINVNEHLEYWPNSGDFFWLTKRGCRSADTQAGSKRPNGYISIHVDGRRQYAHRLAFIAMTGKPPIGVVDHINGNRSDNRWINLRDVSQSENMENRRNRAQANSVTGLIGASPHAGGKFIAQATRGRVKKYLGLHDTAAQAHRAFMEATK